MDTTVAIGTTNQGRKVHMAYKASGQLLCTVTPAAPGMTTVIADLHDDGGQDNTLAILLANRIAPSRLCAHCFFRRIRSLYIARFAQARHIQELFAARPALTTTAHVVALNVGMTARDAQNTLNWLTRLGLLHKTGDGAHPLYSLPGTEGK
uniref:hypothetical protein n=1 Tax=Nonomuraea sp. CA-251285 TaxID=3240002 RepID=UPI003F494790